MNRLAIALVRLYQSVISPYLPSACRFQPTCSEYTLQAIERHGIFSGIRLGSSRIGRCHPWHEGGYDPVPPKADRTQESST